MSSTPRWALRYPELTDAADVPLWMNRLATDLDTVAMDGQGTLAGRPVSTAVAPSGDYGRWYTTTNETAEEGRTHRVYRDHGAGYNEMAALPVTLRMLALEVMRTLVPIGGQLPYVFNADPPGGQWLLADGRLVAIADYPELDLLIGPNAPVGARWRYSGGITPGAGLMRLPDKRGRVSVGADNMGTGAAGRLTRIARNTGNTGGEEYHTLTTPEMPAHTHAASPYYSQASGSLAAPGSVGTGLGLTENAVGPSGSTGGGMAHENMPPYEADPWIVRVR
jgi:microcystin-dependent protein